MAANVAQRNFSTGEVSPSFYGRSDAPGYGQALRTLRNATVKRTGGVQNRPGTEFCGSTKADGLARLVGLTTDIDGNYVIELGEDYLRVWEDGALVTLDSSGGWADTTAYTIGQIVNHNGGAQNQGYICLQSHTSVAVDNEPNVGGIWQQFWAVIPLADGGSYPTGPYIVEFPTPYAVADVFDIQFAFVDVNQHLLVHRSYQPRILGRTAGGSWYLQTEAFTASELTPENLAVSGTGGSNWGYTVTAVDANGNESTAPAAVRTNIAITGTIITTDDIFDTLQGAPRTVTWDAVAGAAFYKVYANVAPQEQLWFRQFIGTNSLVDDGAGWRGTTQTFSPPESDVDFTATDAFPGVAASYQQRLILASTNDEPDRVWASRTGDPLAFTSSDPITDDDALSYRRVGTKLHRIHSMTEVAGRLMQFTSVGEDVVMGSEDAVLTPTNINPRQFSANGAAPKPVPLPVNDTALYVQARGSLVRDLFPVDNGVIQGSDLTLWASHLVDGYTIVDWCFQQTPDPTVWAVRSDGILLSLNYVREAGIFAWATHDTYTSAGISSFKSVTCIPENGRDTVYVLVERTIDGNTVRYVERFADRGDDDWFVDCGRFYTDPETATTLEFLEGEAVYGVIDGGEQVEDGDVTGGGFQTSGPFTTLLVGLPITTDIQTLDIDAGPFTIKDKGQNVGGLIAWLENTYEFYAAPKPPTGTSSTTGMERWTAVNAEGYPATVGDLVTGPYRHILPASWNQSGRIFIRHTAPYPLTILALMPQGYWGGR